MSPAPETSLRDYQAAAIERVFRRYSEGRRGVLLVSPTGSGKSTMGAAAAQRELAAGGRVLWLAPRIELVEQAAATLERAGLTVGVIAAKSERDERPDAQVQVASIQTLLARGAADGWTLIIFDEAHLAAAELWSTLLTRWPDARRLGLTATPARQDGIGLGGLFDVIIVAASIRQLTDAGHLVPLDIVGPASALTAGKLGQHPVAAWKEHAKGRHALLFAANIKQARAFAGDFVSAGISSAVLTGEMSPEDRAATIERYTSGPTRVLCSVGILTTGFDHPPTAVAILARRCGSASLYIQITGRILRPWRLKPRALLIDLAGTCYLPGIGRPDADRVYSLDGRGIRAGEAPPEGSFCSVCGALIEGTTCIDCGFERPAAKDPQILNKPLKLLARDICASDSPEMRIKRLTRWVAQGRELGHKPERVIYRFRGTYGRAPTRDELRAAGAFTSNPGDAA